MATGGAAVAATMVGAHESTATATAAGARGKPVPDELRPGGELDRFAADLAAKDRFSGSLLLTYQGRTVLSRSHGMADKKAGVRNGPDTRFGLASVTKMFTGVAIHQLAEQNKVRYDKPLGAYLDGFPASVADKVTVHHLLCHSSGLGNFQNIRGYRQESRTWDSAKKMFDGTLEYIRRSGTDLAFAPGAGYSYSNTGFVLLGAIVAAVSERSYYEYVAEHVFKAADMRAGAFYTKPQWQSDRRIAHPYHKEKGQAEWVDSLAEQGYIGLPAGGAFATCADMDRFARALLADGTLMGAPYAQLMMGGKIPRPGEKSRSGEPPPESDAISFSGYGSGADLVGGQWVHGHSGGNPLGASATVDIYPAGGWVAVVLSNYADEAAKPIAELAQKYIVRQ